MIIISVSPEYSLAQFDLFVIFAATTAILSLLIALIKYKLNLTSSTVVCTLVFASFIYTGYSSQLNKFNRLTMSGNVMYLEHVWPEMNSYIKAKEVKSITFGVNGIAGSGCFISINLYSGDKYPSVILGQDVTVCKDHRQVLKNLLQK